MTLRQAMWVEMLAAELAAEARCDCAPCMPLSYHRRGWNVHRGTADVIFEISLLDGGYGYRRALAGWLAREIWQQRRLKS